MELKLELKLGKEVARDSSNRTFMELKWRAESKGERKNTF